MVKNYCQRKKDKRQVRRCLLRPRSFVTSGSRKIFMKEPRTTDLKFSSTSLWYNLWLCNVDYSGESRTVPTPALPIGPRRSHIMQSLQLAKYDFTNNVDFDFNEVTAIDDVDVVEICDGVNEFDWRIDTPEASVVEPSTVVSDESERPNSAPQHVVAQLELSLLPTSTSIQERLLHINVREPFTRPYLPFLELRQYSSLLERLVQRNELNMVVITIPPEGKPYSIQLVEAGGKVILESSQFAGRAVLMDYIDRQELPVSLVEDWDQVFPELFYNGCVVVSLTDLRYSCKVHRVTLLRPHSQSLINDADSLHNSSLESSLVNCTQGDLNLDPDPLNGLSHLNNHSFTFGLNTTRLSACIQRQGLIHANRKRRAFNFSQKPAYQPLLDFLNKRPRKSKETFF
ncbi:Spt20 family [Nesidiocoris tenuis]|uniref:Spt20 family n=1 Tax=Nesidiocoris tenuis TaxID=355587 RepID=A0ABN7AGY0_9HEMI|nr:Spt20 family [Nesidiocoris tenuis]